MSSSNSLGLPDSLGSGADPVGETRDVEVVIAVHTTTRPIARAVRSVLTDPGCRVRVLVVCHGLPTGDMAAVLQVDEVCAAGLADDRVRLLPHTDGIASAAGPFNAGLGAATAEYVAVMGSDDHLQSGALAGWWAMAREGRADAVLARLEHDNGMLVATPRARPRRGQRLDLVRDRLAYRTAPLGLLRREVVERLGLRMSEGLPTGEDLEFSTHLWAAAVRVDYARNAPAYVIGGDATDRVTHAARPVCDELAAVSALAQRPWVATLPTARRRAIAVKVLRIHVLDAMSRRQDAEAWSADDVSAIGEVVAAWVALAPNALVPFARADRATLVALLSPGRTPESLAAAAQARAAAVRWEVLLTPRWRDNLDRESTFRHYVGARLSR